MRALSAAPAKPQHAAPAAPARGAAPLPQGLRAGLETLSGIDLSGVRVHHDSTEPDRLDAHAFTRGRDIHLAPGQAHTLPHEAWHAVQQLSGRVRPNASRALNDDASLEAEADRMGARALAIPTTNAAPRTPAEPAQTAVQRRVRINNGAAHAPDADYRPGGPKASVGPAHSVHAMIGDRLRRTFADTAELDAYANGTTDYIGDVVTRSSGTFWYRLPPAQLTVLGERHLNPHGNFEDVVTALRTSRFKYEPFNEVVPQGGTSLPGTRARQDVIDTQYRVHTQVRPGYDHRLDNAVIKALTSVADVRQFLSQNPPGMGRIRRREWTGRASMSDYSGGERAALYLALAIHVAHDIAAQAVPAPVAGEPVLRTATRGLKTFYTAHAAELDALMAAKDGNNLIGLYELTSPGGFAVLPTLAGFVPVFHEYGTRYIEELGRSMGNPALTAEGTRLNALPNADLFDFSPAREEVMWQKVLDARAGGFLLVGMGNAHREALHARLTAAGIANEEVTHSLHRQRRAVRSSWRA